MAYCQASARWSVESLHGFHSALVNKMIEVGGHCPFQVLPVTCVTFYLRWS